MSKSSASLADQIAMTGHALTANELAKLLTVSHVTIFKQAKAGRIPSFRIGTCVRFDPFTVAKWLRKVQRQQPHSEFGIETASGVRKEKSCEIMSFVPNSLRALGNCALRKILPFIAVALVAFACGGTRSTAQQLENPTKPSNRPQERPSLPQNNRELTHKEGIPAHFSTYSLFLVCNPQWLEPERNEALRNLYNQFQNFGRVIGDENLAVWFWNAKRDVTKNSRDGTEIMYGLDVERSVRFCKAWKLTPSAGPHLVITSTYPNDSDLSSGLPKDSAVYELGNMAAKNISALLAKLTDELVEKGHVDSPVAAPLASPTPWVRLLEATQHTINNFGCAWSFKIDAGPVNASLQSCKTR